MAAVLLAFMSSLDDFVVTFFTSGVGTTTLPMFVDGLLKQRVPPDQRGEHADDPRLAGAGRRLPAAAATRRRPVARSYACSAVAKHPTSSSSSRTTRRRRSASHDARSRTPMPDVDGLARDGVASPTATPPARGAPRAVRAPHGSIPLAHAPAPSAGHAVRTADHRGRPADAAPAPPRRLRHGLASGSCTWASRYPRRGTERASRRPRREIDFGATPRGRALRPGFDVSPAPPVARPRTLLVQRVHRDRRTVGTPSIPSSVELERSPGFFPGRRRAGPTSDASTSTTSSR